MLKSASLIALFAFAAAGPAAADVLAVHAGSTTFLVDPQNLKIEADTGAAVPVAVMPPLHPPMEAAVTAESGGWRWRDSEGRTYRLSAEGDALRLRITGAAGTSLIWNLPRTSTGTWLVPDGEGMAFDAADPFWRAQYPRERCLGGTTMLSFPAFAYRTANAAITYALDDGFQSQLCLADDGGLQARLRHDFADGAETLDLTFVIGPPDLLAPALVYRRLLQDRGRLRTLADKTVPGLSRLYAAPHAYVWGDGRSLAFLDDLKALGIDRIVLSYNADPKTPPHAFRPWLRKAKALGYLAGPYEAFDNGQPAATADDPVARWSDDLYPSACIRDANGKIHIGFANRGCEMSSEALVRRHPFAPAERYGAHIADGASQVFVDVDGFGEFFDDFSPDHPMTQARDRANRLARLGMAIDRFGLVEGSENVTAWSAPVAHYSHGTAQAHVAEVWKLLGDKRLGGWWPGTRPPLFFQPFVPTPEEARLLFGPSDRLPLFEAVFHDSVIALDRWEFGLMKLPGQARNRFARALLYGVPTMWTLDRRELARVAPWLKAAADDLRAVNGAGMPAALTGFSWLTPDRLVQQAVYADGRIVTANFGKTPWQGLAPACVRRTRPGKAPAEFCPPPDPAPYRP